jgi:phosphatidate cytidylyltransferase
MYKGYVPVLYPWLFAFVILVLAGFGLSPAAMKPVLYSWSGYLFGMLYVAGLLGHFILLRQLDEGIALIFFVLITTWLADTGGYAIGLPFGRHRLAPTLSPKKTVEGVLGGAVFSVLGAIVSLFSL